ncbi:carboxymuconolactone decarboxylase family protein [Porifericola rhodea]|uniref:carboxymuconolactone decarboxylase family protein n=1 Tax=Porifericola rhodea TaxID=930972 RepID=UPI00266590C4|nr:carboxymuconolactone decarboxylase family protein [Porifericola rhodea]WKN29852.1 carboxymuconolactone decarboxylase family protein [Porifericola rhodea]
METLNSVDYTIRTVEDAPEGAKEFLKGSEKQMGFVPNMYGVMANSPALLDSYLHGYKLFRSKTNFSSVEQEVVFLTISHENACHYCMAAHSIIADTMSKVPEEVTNAIREGKEIEDAKLNALSKFTRTMVVKRGWPSDEDVQDFLDAGYEQNDILNIVLAISVKTISNYSNHIGQTPVDDAFASRTWEK